MPETTETTPRLSQESGPAYRLLVLQQPDPSGDDVVVLGGEPLQIGRVAQPGQRCFRLDHPEVSRNHARVEPTEVDGAFVVRDLGSHNGTFVNRQRIEAHALEDGDVLRIGSHFLMFQVLSADECELLLRRERLPRCGMIGESARMLAVRRAIARAAQTPIPALVTGESGVGKELVARAIHDQSGRTGRYVAVNCAALPQALIESELFGYSRGAFTGASQSQTGLFIDAEGGTLLLDEIGEMPIELQAKLLRALATGEVRTLGTSRARQVDVKVVAATNVALEDAVRAGRFRGDLYARLFGSAIAVPPLRARREDILPLTRHFLGRAGRPPDLTLDPDTVEGLLTHAWPYNVRELEQAVNRLAQRDLPTGARPAAPQIRREPAPSAGPAEREETDDDADSDEPAPAGTPPRRIAKDETPTQAELEAALAYFKGNIKRLAAFYDRNRRIIYLWCKDYGIAPERFR